MSIKDNIIRLPNSRIRSIHISPLLTPLSLLYQPGPDFSAEMRGHFYKLAKNLGEKSPFEWSFRPGEELGDDPLNSFRKGIDYILHEDPN